MDDLQTNVRWLVDRVITLEDSNRKKEEQIHQLQEAIERLFNSRRATISVGTATDGVTNDDGGCKTLDVLDAIGRVEKRLSDLESQVDSLSKNPRTLRSAATSTTSCPSEEETDVVDEMNDTLKNGGMKCPVKLEAKDQTRAMSLLAVPTTPDAPCDDVPVPGRADGTHPRLGEDTDHSKSSIATGNSPTECTYHMDWDCRLSSMEEKMSCVTHSFHELHENIECVQGNLSLLKKTTEDIILRGRSGPETTFVAAVTFNPPLKPPAQGEWVKVERYDKVRVPCPCLQDGIFTAPVDGVYAFFVNVYQQGSGLIQVGLQGHVVMRWRSASVEHKGDFPWYRHTVIAMRQGESVCVMLSRLAGSAGVGTCWFSGWLIR